MSIKSRIKDLANIRHISVAELERSLDFANGSITKWDKQSPSAERLQKVADYFNVSTDYLLGRESKADMVHNMSVDEALGTIMSYDGKPVTEHDKIVMKDLLESYLRNKE